MSTPLAKMKNQCRAKTPTSAPANPGWRYTPHLIIFVSSACVMVVELVAGRLTGRHLGSSLYTWTSIIGVVLAGISIGNWVGGKMADRWEYKHLLGWLFLSASMACIVSLLLNKLVADASFAQQIAMSYPTRVFLSTLVIFLLPALALGTISPVTAKMALDRGGGVGQTIGSVYAWGAVGSIVGTFLTGFWLIATLGSMGVIVAVSLALGLMGLLLGPRRAIHAVWVVLLIVLMVLTQRASGSWFQIACRTGLQDGIRPAEGSDQCYMPYRFARDSHYQYVRVQDQETGLRLLMLDCDHHSMVDPANPAHLDFKYTRIYGSLCERLFAGQKTIDAFFIGGGGFTFPRWILNRWPGSTCEVAEIDPAVVQASRQALGLVEDSHLRIQVNDARMVVAGLPAGRTYDLIVGDAFNNELNIPWQLTTLEFHQQLKRHLRPGGILLANVIDDYDSSGKFLGAYLQTVQRLFKHVRVFCADPDGPGGGAENFVVVATDNLDPRLEDYFRTLYPGHGEPFAGSLLTLGHLANLAEKCNHLVLTDDYAPVENLIAPAERVGE